MLYPLEGGLERVSIEEISPMRRHGIDLDRNSVSFGMDGELPPAAVRNVKGFMDLPGGK